MDIISLIKESEPFRLIESAARRNGAAALFGAHAVHRAVYAAALSDALGRPVIIVTDTDAEAARMAADAAQFVGTRAVNLPSRDFVFLDVEGTSHELESERLSVLGRIVSGQVSVVAASLEAYCQRTIPRDVYEEFSFTLKPKDKLPLDSLIGRLFALGYTRGDRVDGRGQFALRGGILDVFPADMSAPVRVDFFGGEAETVSSFDTESQRSTAALKKAVITPARETLLGDREAAAALLEKRASRAAGAYEKLLRKDIELIRGGIMPPATDRYMPLCYKKKVTLADYFDGAVTLYSEPSALRSRARTLAEQHWAETEKLIEEGILERGKDDFYRPFESGSRGKAAVYADVFARMGTAAALDELVNINASVLPKFTGELKPLLQEIKGYIATGFAVRLFVPTKRAAENIAADIANEGVEAFAAAKDEGLRHGAVAVSPGALSSGFEIPGLKLAVFTGAKTANAAVSARRERKDKNAFGSLEDLREGDYIVHKNHGIGMFDGIHRIDHHGLVRDYIKIKYNGSDVLYLPVTQLDMVTQYVAPRGAEHVSLAKLHSGEWQKTKQSVYRSAREMAKELIALYAERGHADGVAFSEDGEWQSEFEGRFIYEETGDQLRASGEIKGDMVKAVPMDRLLCGDVGVGKTEVALRAAFKCVTDGYQCAVLVPTTILAWQHLNTFLERMEPYPVKVAMLSRFSSAAELKEAAKGIKNGTVDIAIGTHRLLQKDVEFKKLGLLIVDEEQRFGVGHKEKLKQQFPGVDVLTLSATPIPRTLNMAMSGLRDMSVIEDPPEDRYPVQTFVMEYDLAVVRDAIERELARGGQVFYLHNRVETIERAAFELRGICPEARVETAHGQMSEEELSCVWKRMFAGEVDVLCCTTIIETGVDVSNCNTLIVEEAQRLGLAQLYQIRGRVGRGNRRAFAYFTFRRDSVLTEVAAKRLSAIRDFTSFGSGFKIAMRDLQIRGAGGILSARQSGHMQSVGYDTYIDILNEAIDDEKGVPRKKKRAECTVDITVSAYIPDGYIADGESRIEMYKLIAAVETKEDASDVLEELRDRFGEVPASVEALVSVALIRAAAGELEIYEISQKDDKVFLYTDSADPEAVKRLIRDRSRQVMVSAKGKSYISVGLRAGELPVAAAVETLEIMSGAG